MLLIWRKLLFMYDRYWSMHRQCGTHILLKIWSESNSFRGNSLNGSLAWTNGRMRAPLSYRSR